MLLLSGCASGPKTPQDLIAAQALERGGDHDEEALAAWRRIAEERCAVAAPLDGGIQHDGAPERLDPKDDCGLAGAREAELLEKLNRPREAEDAWRRSAARARLPSHAAHALASEARLRADLLDDGAGASAIAWGCVERYPDQLPADDCLAIAVRLERSGDARALVQRIDALASRLATTDLVDNLRSAAADLTEHELADATDAVRRYDALAASYRRSSLRDDALWRGAHILLARDDFQGALVRLRLLLKTRRRALITGSYNSEFLDDAQLLMGRILLDKLHDTAGAIAAFTRLADDFRESTLRDDALLELSRAEVSRGDRAASCAALARLLREFPDGNQARTAAARSAVECGPPRSGARTNGGNRGRQG